MLWACAPSARADATRQLEQGKRLSLQLELEAALASFQMALDTGALTRTQLIELLGERAFVYHALSDKDALIEDFVWLSALDPEYRLDLRAPPDLRASWTATRDQGRGALRITLHAETRESGEILAHAALIGTVPPGVTARLFVRTGDGAFRVLPEPTLHERAAHGASRDFYAEAIGLGGVVIARAYDRDTPLHVVARVTPEPAAALPPAPVRTPAPPQSDQGQRRRLRNWMIGAASLVAGAGVLTAVLLTRARDQEPSDPKLRPVVSF